MDEHLVLQAEALAQSQIDDAIQRARANLPVLPLNWDGLCTACGDPVPVARINFGASTCVTCQSHLERRR